MFTKLKNKFQFSDYQVAQLKYLFLTIISETSKLLIMGLIFRKESAAFLYGIVLFSALRLSTGGLHCKTYLGCFFTTFAFLFLAIRILPLTNISLLVMSLILCSCGFINFIIGPITSEKRLPLKSAQKKRLAYQSILIIFIHMCLFIYCNNELLKVGSWLIILHTLQLIISKYKEKEVKS